MRDIGSRQSPLRNLVLAQEHHALLLLGILDKVLEELNASGNARYAVMCADRHHASPVRGLSVENVEVVS